MMSFFRRAFTVSLQMKVDNTFKPALRIRDIFVWIRIRIWIRGSMPLTNGSGYGSCYFRHCPSKCQQRPCTKGRLSFRLLENGWLVYCRGFKVPISKVVSNFTRFLANLLQRFNSFTSGSTFITKKPRGFISVQMARRPRSKF
jgi:hypothetical protein